MTIAYYFILTLFVVVSLFMILLVLIQKGRGGGLASAFGGAGGNTAFGAKTGDVLTWVTSGTFVVFLVLAVALNLVSNRIGAPVARASSQLDAGTPASQPSQP
jgi:preprotein translocase subunit SecG